MIKAINRLAYIYDVSCNAENIELNSHGNLHKAANFLNLCKGTTKKTIENNIDDYEFQLFHSIGKFLYNKSNLKIGIDKDGNIRVMQFYELQDPKTRPGLYFSPEDIINRASCEPSSFWIYLEENCLDFYGDIEDSSNLFEILQVVDCIDYKKLKDNYPLSEYLPSYLAGRAVLNFNNHPAPCKFMKIAAPVAFSFSRKLEESKCKLDCELKPDHTPLVTFITEIAGYSLNTIQKIYREEAEETELWEEITYSMDSIKF
jgi:hypothetical protein